MTLEEFRKIKSEFLQLYHDVEEYYNDDSRDRTKDDEVSDKFLEDVELLQQKLLSRDLSDIPFEEWEGLYFISDGKLDFSKTHANIDFSLLREVEFETIDLSGCNVRGLQALDYEMDTFSPEFMKKHPEAFPDESLPLEIKEKFFANKITFSDLFQYPTLKKCISEKSFKYANPGTKFFVDAIGYENAIKFFEEYPEFAVTITDNANHIYWKYLTLGDNSYDSVKQRIFNNIIDSIKTYSTILPDLDIIPVEMIEMFPNIFVQEGELPEDVINNYYAGNLSIRDFRIYKDVLKNKDLEFATRSYESFSIRHINKLFGSIWDYIDKVPMELDYIVNSYLIRHKTDEETINKISEMQLSEIISEMLSEILSRSGSFEFKDLDSLDVFSQYLPIEKMGLSENEVAFIEKIGLKNLIDFNHNHDEILDVFGDYSGTEFWRELAANFDVINDDITINNEEELLDVFRQIIHKMRASYSLNVQKLFSENRKDLVKLFPDEFIDYDLLYEILSARGFSVENIGEFAKVLDKSINGNFNNFESILNTYPYLIPVLEDKTIIFPKGMAQTEDLYQKIGSRKFLEVCSKYGLWFSTVFDSLSSVDSQEKLIELIKNGNYEEQINQYIYELISAGKRYNIINLPQSFKDKYPELFISPDAPEELQNFFYDGLDSMRIFLTPEIVPYLMNVDLSRSMRSEYVTVVNANNNEGSMRMNLYEALGKIFSQEEILELLSKYGMYIVPIDFCLDLAKSKEEVYNALVESIYLMIKDGYANYNDTTLPKEFMERYPNLFLDENAPDALKKAFYWINYHKLTFGLLSENKDEWLSFLKDKDIKSVLVRDANVKEECAKYFSLFGDEKALKLAIGNQRRAETVTEMINSHQVDLMKSWYDKTGGKFIPDFVVMQNFRLEEADKFLAAGSNWSRLMRIESFAKSAEARDAMLKLAYSFGAFDQDQRGFKKVQDLLTDLPRKISADYYHIMDSISNLAVDAEAIKEITSSFPAGYQEYVQLKDTLVNEGFNLDTDKEVFGQVYCKNEDGSYSLAINTQDYPKSTQLIRAIMEIYPDSPIISPIKAHQLFGGFELKYDPDFREFLLANVDKILENPEYTTYVSSVQRHFSEIKAINSNRLLTWDLAVSYVQTNKFTSVNTGNEKVAEISAIAGYSQADFDTLQRIYNYGKQRVFSSIPRIENTSEKKSGNYSYEILRLDDPLAMAIGTLTDCCQELNNCAEVCMEHSMVDKNGRVFVIKDEMGNIVAQSWVWRNKDVLCFDNIEIPDKAFSRVVRLYPDLGRKGFTDDVFEIYKQAAHELIEEDEKVYRELFESGKITQEQYDGLRLGKVTVGLGYNDIAVSLKQHSKVDTGYVSRPVPFSEPVKLSRGLYTNDSTTQYVLEEREDRKEFDGESINVHSDQYIKYDDSTFTEKDLLSLEKLELVTKEDPMFLETAVQDDVNKEHLVTALARNYRLNPDTTKIIKHPNFAIIYDVNDDVVKIADLFFNTKVDNESQQMDIEDKVLIQIKLALEQIAKNKKIDISDLNSKQKAMYEKAISLSDELDTERGLNNAR